MDFFADGSRINLHVKDPVLGWGSVCEWGIIEKALEEAEVT